VARVVGLETRERYLLEELELWRGRCLETQRRFADVAQLEDQAQDGLFATRAALAASVSKSADLEAAHVEQQNAQLRIQSELCQSRLDARQAQERADAAELEAEGLRQALADARSEAAGRLGELQAMQEAEGQLKRELEMACEASQEARLDADFLKAEVLVLQAARAKGVEEEHRLLENGAAERQRTERLRGVNYKLRMACQEAFDAGLRREEVIYALLTPGAAERQDRLAGRAELLGYMDTLQSIPR